MVRPATSHEVCPFSRLGQHRDCRGRLTVGELRVRIGGGQPTRESVGFSIQGCKIEVVGEMLVFYQRFLERAWKRVTSAESAIAEAVAEKDRLVAELAEGADSEDGECSDSEGRDHNISQS